MSVDMFQLNLLKTFNIRCLCFVCPSHSLEVTVTFESQVFICGSKKVFGVEVAPTIR